ncbi:MAG: 2-oxo-4-hydroxy-4-carboxy-5-ureidoimidazoline decarboxylase [Mycobacteriaceae bacterium]|uniref:2-oxo-4-hydroxy-4-carboxy-5-ureidoimidazoline decarboxylase n=1 Tax=Corynebacterium sp. TaxID=1720 RepID=UPI003F98D798
MIETDTATADTIAPTRTATPFHTTIADINQMTPTQVAAMVGDLLYSPQLGEAVATAMPFRNLEHLLDSAHRELLRLPRVEVLTSIKAHPVLGQKTTDIYSREEQSFILESPPEVLTQIADLCRRYEERFHHLFLVCAQGIGGHEVLRLLQRRLDNPTVTEWETTVRELGRINILRLRSVVK